jgi:hypothetical protein
MNMIVKKISNIKGIIEQKISNSTKLAGNTNQKLGLHGTLDIQLN